MGAEFFDLYRATAQGLARRLKMDEEIDDDLLEHAQRRWRIELAERLRNRPNDPDDERFYIVALGGLGVRLCRENCVTYTIVGMNTTNPHFTEHQSLLQTFAPEYTGMEFVRILHWDVYSSLSPVKRLPGQSALVTFDPAELRHIFGQIRESPERVRDYPRLLHLPE